MNGSQDLFTSTAPDAAAVAAQRGRLRYYLEGQSTSVGRYVLEQTLFFFLRGIPSLVGVGLRALAYRLILHSDGLPVIEDQVRLCRRPTSTWVARSTLTMVSTCTPALRVSLSAMRPL